MTTPAFPTSLPAFVAQFGTEAKCYAYLSKLRWPQGFVCPACGGGPSVRGSRGAKFDKERQHWRCPCGHDASLTAGTSFHRSKQSLQTWFYAAWIVCTLKTGISALQFQSQLGISRYETAWNMLHKLRAALFAPDRDKLHTVVSTDKRYGEIERWIEVDEFYVGGTEKGVETRGRGAQTKALVVAAVEVIARRVIDPKTDKTVVQHISGRCRLRVVPDGTAETLTGFIMDNIERGSAVHTDGLSSYASLGRLGFRHVTFIAKQGARPLTFVGLVQTNFNRLWIGIYKGAVSAEHLQSYCNEFVWRFNRRNDLWQSFHRALGLAMMQREAPTYRGLYDGTWTHRNPALRPQMFSHYEQPDFFGEM